MKKIQATLAIFLSAVFGLSLAVSLPGPVVSSEWLAANQSAVQILEVRSNMDSFKSEPEFQVDKKTGKKNLVDVGGHIQNASILDFKNIRVERTIDGKKIKYLIPEKIDFQKMIQATGLNSDKPIVLVPIGMSIGDIDEALRAYWQFKVYGEDNIAVLDGGMAGWLIEGRPYTTKIEAKSNGNWVATAERSELVAGSEEVAAASKNGGATLLDTRQPAQFYGLSKRAYVGEYGHIAGAKDFAPELMVKPIKGALYFWDKNTYMALFKDKGIDSQSPTISYCNSGHLAAGGWFLMSELVGNKSTKLYDGSLYLWTMEGRPVVGVPLN